MVLYIGSVAHFDNYTQECDQDETSNSNHFPTLISYDTFYFNFDATDTWFRDLLLEILVTESSLLRMLFLMLPYFNSKMLLIKLLLSHLIS